MAPPVLTARLALRAYVPEDGPEAHEVLFSDPEVMRHVGGALTREQTDVEIARAIGWQEQHGYSFWPVFERETGLMVGEAGLVPEDGTGPGIELGYALARGAWGQGFASEIVAALLGVAFAELGAGAVSAHVRDGNDASVRVLEKAGFSPAGRATAWGAEQQRFLRTRAVGE